MDKTRFSGIFNASNLSVTLIGAGGIGAITGITLAKMGVGHLVVHDDDVVSEENIPTQFHPLSSVGNSKVISLQEQIAMYADETTVIACNTRIAKSSEIFGSVVISAVDSIEARKDIWAALQKNRIKPEYYLDARMGAEEFQLYAVNMQKDYSWYDNLLRTTFDSDIPDLPCTEKATFYCACVAAGIIGSTVRKIVTGVEPAKFITYNILSDQFFSAKD